MLTPSTPKPREGALLWTIKILGGLLIIVFLGIHFIINHLVAPEGLLNYEQVLNYYQNPLIPLMEIVFLVFVIGHSLLGLRSIILDLNPTARLLKILDILFIIIGGVGIIYGTWLALFIARLGG